MQTITFEDSGTDLKSTGSQCSDSLRSFKHIDGMSSKDIYQVLQKINIPNKLTWVSLCPTWLKTSLVDSNVQTSLTS